MYKLYSEVQRFKKEILSSDIPEGSGLDSLDIGGWQFLYIGFQCALVSDVLQSVGISLLQL